MKHKIYFGWLFILLIYNGILYSQSNVWENVRSSATPNSFTYPQSIFVDSPNGQIWITDFENNRVLRFDVLSLTSISESSSSSPLRYQLNQNYPNPFNSTTKITFIANTAGRITLVIYNLLGQQIATLFDEFVTTNKLYSISFDAGVLPSGIYFYSLHTDHGTEVKKMCLLK